MSYNRKMAEKNKIPYMIANNIYLGDLSTIIKSTPDGYEITSPTSKITSKDGKLYISGNINMEDSTPLNLNHTQDVSYMEDSPDSLWKNQNYAVSSAIGYWKVQIGKRYGMIPIFELSKVDENSVIDKEPSK